MKGLTLLNVKRLNLNTTIFVIDEEFKEFSKLNGSEQDYFYSENFESLFINNKVKINQVEYLWLLSSFGPMYLNTDVMYELIDCLFKGFNNKIINFYNINNFCHVDDYIKNLFKEGKYKFNIYDKFNNNIIFNFVFLVKDLDSLLNKLKDKKVNGGPQKKEVRLVY